MVKPTPPAQGPGASLTVGEVIAAWWPLGLSWLLMVSEMPLTSAIISRLPLPEINLAAWGVIFNLANMIQAPATMLLSAATAMVSDAPSYRRLRNIAFTILGFLTLLHFLLGYTPLFDVILIRWLGLPTDVANAARLAAMILAPWSFATGSRRFFHGILIRYGHSRIVIAGTVMRLAVAVIFLAIGLSATSYGGATVAAVAITAAVLMEMVYAWIRARPVIRQQVLTTNVGATPFTYTEFFRFYVPLVLTTILSLSIVTFVSAALARMPGSLESLAVWPVVSGFLMIWQSVAFSLQEVVISLLRRRGAPAVLMQVTRRLALGVTIALVLVSATPLAMLWFRHGAALSPELAHMARIALLVALLVPAMRAVQSWLQGALVFARRTLAMTESIVVFLLVTGIVLMVGITTQAATGLYFAMVAYVLGMAAQTAWLAYRVKPVLMEIRLRDAQAGTG